MSLPTLIVAPYDDVVQLLVSHNPVCVVSILGRGDRLPWPVVGESRRHIRLEFDDTTYSSGEWVAPTRAQIAELIGFAREWGGVGSMLVHCRAGTSRSPAAAMIVLAALGRDELGPTIVKVASGKSYFRPHRGMLKLADDIFGRRQWLTDFAEAVLPTGRVDDVGPIGFCLPPVRRV